MSHTMQIAHRSQPNALRTLVWSLLLIGAGMLGLHTAVNRVGPELMADADLSIPMAPVRTGQIVGARCHKWFFPIQSCSAILVLPMATPPVQRRSWIIFVDPGYVRWYGPVLVDPARPDHPTTILAMTQIWNRTLTLAGLMLASLGLVIGGVVVALRHSRV